MNFTILVSPVIDLGVYAQKGSQKNLLGVIPSADLINKYSANLPVNKSTPPAFVVHASDDKVVSVKNSLLYYEGLLKNSIPSSLHIFPQGGHSIALRNNPGSTNLWTALCEQWLIEMGIIPQMTNAK